MPDTVLSVENLSKQYQLGAINTGTFRGDVERWWANLRGRPDPYQRIGGINRSVAPGKDLWALKDINFQVRQGEALGIIGRNGAGKSTLLKILSRVTAPTSGAVKIKGRIASLLEVGTGFHPELTGRENAFLNGAILGMKKEEIERRFDEIVDFAGIDQHIDTPVKRYSSGMYVRLAFAVAAHLEPEILVVDEVLAVGDAEFQKKCLGKMDDVAHAGRTVLFVSHNMPAVARLCRHGLVIDRGALMYDGSAAEAINVYFNLQTSSKEPILEVEHDEETAGAALIKRIAVQSNGQPSTSVEVGGPLDISLWLQLMPGHSRLKVAIVIEDMESGQRLFTLTPQLKTPHLLDGLPDYTRLNCKIPSVPLIPGSYQVKFVVSEGERTNYLEQSIMLNIHDPITSDQSFVLSRSKGMFWVDADWEVAEP